MSRQTIMLDDIFENNDCLSRKKIAAKACGVMLTDSILLPQPR